MRQNRSQFPTDEAGLKLLWLAMCDIEDTRARRWAKDKGKAAAEPKALAD